jgi:hypothetical protein
MGTGTNFTPQWCVVDKETKEVNLFCVDEDGNLQMQSGSRATSIADDDDFLLFRNDSSLRVTAEVLASYIVMENTTTKELTFADSPYTVLSTDDYINVDATGGNVVINLLPLATVPTKPIYIRKNAGGANTVTLDPNGSETIDGAATLVISSDGNAETVVPFSAEWRTF